jgi:NADPH:quinone reductase-like Zn-dependent oxidoreductase
MSGALPRSTDVGAELDRQAADVTVRAAIAERYGTPDVIRLVDLPVPVPAADEVLVRIHATTVNRTDLGVLSGSPAFARLFYGLTKPKHPVLGNEFAGVVEAVGDDVTSFAVGSECSVSTTPGSDATPSTRQFDMTG